MIVKVAEVEEALDDVKELLAAQHTPAQHSDTHNWEREWIRIVQDVVEKDSGWKSVSIYIFLNRLH